jgi:hypothetical protein
MALLLAPSLAQADDLHLPNVDVQKIANGVLSLMSYSAVPDLASSSLSIDNAESGNPSLMMTQLGERRHHVEKCAGLSGRLGRL